MQFNLYSKEMVTRCLYSIRQMVIVALLVLEVAGCTQRAPGGSSTLARSAQGVNHGVASYYTCGGCPESETGSSLRADLVLASAGNMVLSDLPVGWSQTRNPPKPSSDIPFGIVDPKGANQFSSCMSLSSSQKVRITKNSDQVLNVGSPIFSPLTSEDQVSISSWIDMVKSSGDARSDLAVSTSPKVNKCAAPLYAGIFKATTGVDYTSNKAGLFSISVDQQTIALPSPAVGYIRTVSATRQGIFKSYFGFFTLGRVQGQCTLIVSMKNGLEELFGKPIATSVSPTPKSAGTTSSTSANSSGLSFDPIGLVTHVMSDMVDRINSASKRS